MPDILEPADAEQAVIDELVTTFLVGSSLPQTLPPVFLRVVSSGGTQRDLVTDATLLTLEAFAKTETVARATINRALGLLQYAAERKGSIGNETCYGLAISALPQNFPLPSVPDRKRYVATIAPAFRRRSVTI